MYDVDVAYQGKPADRQFVGKLPRNAVLSDVLKVLELNGIRFRLDGKKLTVMP